MMSTTIKNLRSCSHGHARTVGLKVGRTDGGTLWDRRTRDRRSDERSHGRSDARTVGRTKGLTVGRTDGRSEARMVFACAGLHVASAGNMHDHASKSVALSIPIWTFALLTFPPLRSPSLRSALYFQFHVKINAHRQAKNIPCILICRLVTSPTLAIVGNGFAGAFTSFLTSTPSLYSTLFATATNVYHSSDSA